MLEEGPQKNWGKSLLGNNVDMSPYSAFEPDRDRSLTFRVSLLEWYGGWFVWPGWSGLSGKRWKIFSEEGRERGREMNVEERCDRKAC